MMLKDRRLRDVVKYRIAVGHPGDAASKRPPRELDHFVVTTTEKDRSGMFIQAAEVHRIVGETPRRLEFFVDSDDIEDFCRQQYSCSVRVEGTVVEFCKGDGEKARRLVKRGEWADVPCRAAPTREDGSGYKDRLPKDLVPLLEKPSSDNPASGNLRCPFAQNSDPQAGPACKPVTELLVRLASAPGGVSGFARYRSHGHRTADQIVQSLIRIKEVTGGVLRGVPLALVCQRTSMRRPDGKNATHTTTYVELAVAPQQALEAAMMTLSHHGKLMQGVSRARALLDAPRGAEDLEAEAAEFTVATVASVEDEREPDFVEAVRERELPSGPFTPAVVDDGEFTED
jgi:hypothetical protein